MRATAVGRGRLRAKRTFPSGRNLPESELSVFVAVVLASLAVAPAPTASPLREIIRVTTRPLCTALKDRIGPSVAALLENDAAASDGTHQIFEMAGDGGRPWMQIDKLHLENDISRIVRNLDVVDHLLRTADAEAAAKEGADRDAIEKLAAKLRAVADAQRAQLNTLDGTLESEQMAELMNSNLPLALTSSGFALGGLKGDELSSDSAAYSNSVPQPVGTNAPGAAPPSLAPHGHATTPALPQQMTHGNGNNTYVILDARGAGDSRSELALEKAFTRSLIPVAAQCQRLNSPQKP